MSYDNVKLWFANNENGKIITIEDINDDNKSSTYSCPMCGSNLIPKATKSIKVSSHFAHVDASKCNAETMIHWWFKNKFLEKGDNFVVVSDKEREYTCEEVLVEQNYKLNDDKTYNPDVTVLTECGETIYFEMDYSNKKKIEDYIDIWLELKNIVVEVDVKKLMGKDRVPEFKALFYNGKCFNTKKNDTYYNIIGKYKEEKLKGKFDEEVRKRIKKLDWFWDDVLRYRNGEIDEEHLSAIINMFNFDEMGIVVNILNKTKCINLYKNLHLKYKERKKKREAWYFEKVIPKENIFLIKKAVNKLEKMYKKTDNKYSFSVYKEANKQKVHEWRFGRKIGVWKTSSYSYFVKLLYEGSWVKREYILGIVVEMDCVDEIFKHFEKLFIEHKI